MPVVIRKENIIARALCVVGMVLAVGTGACRLDEENLGKATCDDGVKKRRRDGRGLRWG